MSINPFDFSDVSDLPEELAKRVSNTAAANPNVAIFADVVKAGYAAGVQSLSISQIEVAARRMGVLPADISQQSIRNALNTAIKSGLIKKASRQSYTALEGKVDETATAEDLADETVVEVAEASPEVTLADSMVDPLA